MRLAALLLAIPLLAACSKQSSPIPAAEAAEARRPVVVELFSSEGCSSCPPADIVLRDLSRAGSHGGAEIIAIEEHVDYWNDLGWADPFSSPAWSARQRAYSTAMGHRSVYTPQAVIDGQAELVGSDKEGVLEAIAEAAKKPKARVTLTREGDVLRVAVTEMPAPRVEAEVLVALTEEGLATAVPRGENAGVTVVHAPIARSMEKIGTFNAVENIFAMDATLPKTPDAKRGKQKAIVIVQATGKKAILGAAAIPWG